MTVRLRVFAGLAVGCYILSLAFALLTVLLMPIAFGSFCDSPIRALDQWFCSDKGMVALLIAPFTLLWAVGAYFLGRWIRRRNRSS